MQKECSLVSKDMLNDCILDLPIEQQEMVTTIFNEAKCKSSKGRRYSLEWVYECLLMRIKGPKFYKKMRKENKLGRYIKKLHTAYGFQENTFQVMKEEAQYNKLNIYLIIIKYKLHINPSNYQKMNVKMAMQVCINLTNLQYLISLHYITKN